jgi:spore coat protein U-like protein
MIRRFALASAILIAAGSTAPAMAQTATATSNLTVTATVGNVCTISSASIVFGSYDPVTAHNGTTGSPLDGSGTVTTTCTNLLPATITLGQGSNPATAPTASTDAAPLRQLANGANRLRYDLYQTALPGGTGSAVWGNTGGTGLAVTGTGSAVTSTIYGRIPRGQTAPAGVYNDTVVATVTF